MGQLDQLRNDAAVTAGVIDTNESVTSLLESTRLLSENAIPVPSSIGEIFKQRYEDALKLYEEYHKDWKRAIEIYHNTGSIAQADEIRAPEQNMVRIIVQTLLDLMYMQNPTAEFSTMSNDQATRDFAQVMSDILTIFVNRRNGFNLRPYVLLQMAMAHLTNYGILKLVYTKQEVSQERVLALYTKAKEAAQKETDPEKAAVWYSLLDTLYPRLNQTQPFGLGVKFVWPMHFFSDTEGKLLDLTDAKWTMEVDFIETAFLKSEYMFLDDDNVWRFKYDKSKTFEKSVSAKDTTEELQAQILDRLMPEETPDKTRLRVKDKTACIWIQDRATRQTYLYILDRWDCPVWVYEDELQLSRFFHYFILSFSAGTGSVVKRSESSYYIPFQDEINKIEYTKAFVREVAFNTYVYNADGIDAAEVTKLLKNVEKRTKMPRAIGLKLKDRELELEKLIKPFLLPSAQVEVLFNTDTYSKAVDNASRLSSAFRGQEFKTNTTNQAIQQYQSSFNSRLTPLTDAVEECVEQIFWAIAEVLVSKYPKDQIANIVGTDKAEMFKSMPVNEFNLTLSMSVEAGSSEKENSNNKKQEATQIIQMLGQFGKAAPQSILTLIFKMLRNVFSKKLISDNDIKSLQQETSVNAASMMQQPQQPQTPTQGTM